MKLVGTGQIGSDPYGLSIIFFFVEVHPEVTPKCCDGHLFPKLGIDEKFIGKPQKKKRISLQLILDADPLFKRHFSGPIQGLSE